MCWYLHLIVATDCDLERLNDVAARHGFQPRDPSREFRIHLDGYRVLLPYESHCDCGTEVGSSHRKRRKEEDLRRLASKGKRRRWSEARRTAWIQQQLDADRRGDGTHLGSTDELDQWCAFAKEAAATRNVGTIGILKLWVGSPPVRDQPCARTRATPDGLRNVEPGRPTLLAG